MRRLHRAGLHGIQRLQGGHHLARAEDADLEAVLGQFRDGPGEDLAGAIDGIEAGRIAAGQPPADRRCWDGRWQGWRGGRRPRRRRRYGGGWRGVP